MSNLKLFMKENKVKRENVEYAVTQSLRDEDGQPLKWVIRNISTREDEILRDECTVEVMVKGKNVYRPKLDANKYITKLICASVVEPNLNDKTLQDAYGVLCAEDLLKEMVDNPVEYSELAAFVQNNNGFVSLKDKVDYAKN